MADLSGTVSVPALGKVPKKEAAIGAVVVGVLVIVYYARHRQSTAAAGGAASATTTDQYPADGTTGNPSDPYSTDPATGATYGNEAAGSGGTLGAFGTGAGTGSDSLSGTTGTSSGSSGGPPFSTNDQWVNWALQQEQTINPAADIGAWQTALGLYVNGQPVDPGQKSIIFDAIAIAGNPPVAGPGNYPPNVRTNGSKGPGPSPERAAVPNVTAEQAQDAINTVEAAGFRAHVTPARKPGYEYVVTGQSPKGGRTASKGSTVTIDVREVRKLAKR